MNNRKKVIDKEMPIVAYLFVCLFIALPFDGWTGVAVYSGCFIFFCCLDYYLFSHNYKK